MKTNKIYKPVIGVEVSLTLYETTVEAGLPNTVEDYASGTLDLNEHLLHNPTATFFVRVSGDSMIGAGLHPGDLLIVDRSIPPASGRIIIAVINGEMTVKRLFRDKGKLSLMPENPSYPTIEITEDMDFMVWGVVTNVIHSV
jgi:DNA polymerase V